MGGNNRCLIFHKELYVTIKLYEKLKGSDLNIKYHSLGIRRGKGI